MRNRVIIWSTLVFLAVTIAALATATQFFLPNAHGLNVTATAKAVETPEANEPVPNEPVPERVFAQPELIVEETDLPPVEKDPTDYPNLDSNLNRLAQAAAEAPRPASADGQGSGPAAEPVLATFYISPNHVADVRAYLEEKGVFVRNVGDDYIEAHVPPGRLRDASERPGVLRVDTVIPPRPAQTRENVASQGVGLHGAEAWHDAGYRGDGVRVGIIDSGFAGFSWLQGSELPGSVSARCYFAGARAPSSSPQHCEVDSDHGTAVAETLIDVAPAVKLYIANPHTLGDFRDAVDWMASQGVRVINHSRGTAPDGPGDGTSPFSNSLLRTIDAAVASNIAWINSGGNEGLKVWHGTYTDPGNTGLHHFRPNDLSNAFSVEEGDEVRVFMRWEDNWGRADCDLDLELYKGVRGRDGKYPRILQDNTAQDGSAGSMPRAAVGFSGKARASDAGVYFLAIRKYDCAEEPAWIQLIAWISSPLQYRTPTFHMGNPEESRNPGMLAVGATHYTNTQAIASYSSRGPTLDGRIKPDITGVACGRSTILPVFSLDGAQCWFRGTSQSAPHVAGLAALAQQRFPDYTPAQLTDYLRQNAAERGIAGADNTWGHGLAALPRPSAPAAAPEPGPGQQPAPGTGPVPGPAPGPLPGPAQNVAPAAANLAVRDGASAGQVIVSWDAAPEATYYRIGSVNMKTDYPAAKASVSGEWRSAFVYSDVSARDFTVENGRVEYVIRRLEPGARHAFTVHTSGDATYGIPTYGGRFRWPGGSNWAYHVVP